MAGEQDSMGSHGALTPDLWVLTVESGSATCVFLLVS
jgi:hypothetical protein